MKKPILSLVMPVYNIGDLLNRSIKSILEQTYQDYELILVDDGSTDDSGTICDYYASIDERIKVVHKKNGGPGSARNAGIDAASCDYIAFPDADDLCKPNMYEHLMESTLKVNSDLTVCLYEVVQITDQNEVISTGNSGKLFSRIVNDLPSVRETWFDVCSQNIGLWNVPWNKIYKTSIIKKNGIRFPDIRRAQDAVFNMLYYDKIESLCILDEYLYQYNANDAIKVGKKFPKDVYQCFFYLDKVYVDTINGWGMYYGNYKALCDNHLLGALDQCVTMCENPAWNLSKTQKLDYLSTVMDNSYLQEKLASYEGFVYEIEDLIQPTLKHDAKGILKVLRKRKIKDALRSSILGTLYRKLKH